MATLEIPLRSDVKAYQFSVDLETVIYQFSITYNQRMGRWILDILDQDGNDVLLGIVLLQGIPLIDRFIGGNYPAGRLILIDTTGLNREAGENDLGNDHRLIYEEST